jgi:hypothetical protein
LVDPPLFPTRGSSSSRDIFLDEDIPLGEEDRESWSTVCPEDEANEASSNESLGIDSFLLSGAKIIRDITTVWSGEDRSIAVRGSVLLVLLAYGVAHHKLSREQVVVVM